MSRQLRPSGVSTFRLNDVDQLSLLFARWRGRFEQISAGRFEGTLRAVGGELVRGYSIEANQKVRIRGGDDGGLISINTITAGSADSLWQGHRLAVGQMVLTGPDTEFNYTSPRRTAHRAAVFRPDALGDAARTLLGSQAAIVSPHWAAITPPPAVFARIDQQLARLIDTGSSATGFMRTPEGRLLEQEFVRAVVAAFDFGVTIRPDLPLPCRQQLVRSAEEVMRERLADPLGAVDLCRQLRVSDRTLRLAFRERFGLGPMGYYKRLRLNAVRSALKADPLLAVGDAARHFGFHHLGNFSADYRRLFGVKPSDTRR